MADTNPYGPAAPADIVLRSSDGSDFYVIKAFLCYVSQIFKGLFDLSQEFVLEMRSGLPIVHVTETGKTLRLLLDSIYPQEYDPQLNDVTLFLSVAKAAQKYRMDKVEKKLRKRIIDSRLTDEEPFRMYAVAMDLGWEDVAIHMARQTLQTPLEKLALTDELKNITGSSFYLFWEYRIRCKSSSKPEEEEFMKLPIAVTNTRCTTSSASPALSSKSKVGQISRYVDAQEPFDSSAPSDVVLRSSDSVDFFIHEALIRIASPLLSPTILSKKVKGEARNGLAIIQIPEESSVLHQLLCLIYFYPDQLDMQNCRLYTRVVLAIRRYEMTAIETRLQAQAAVTPLLSKEPFRVYIVASALGWDDLAKSAALCTLSQPLAEMGYIGEFDLITGADLYRLVAFRFRCAAMYKIYGPGRWSTRYHPSTGHCGPAEKIPDDLRSYPQGLIMSEAYKLVDDELEMLRNDNLLSIDESALFEMSKPFTFGTSTGSGASFPGRLITSSETRDQEVQTKESRARDAQSTNTKPASLSFPFGQDVTSSSFSDTQTNRNVTSSNTNAIASTARETKTDKLINLAHASSFSFSPSNKVSDVAKAARSPTNGPIPFRSCATSFTFGSPGNTSSNPLGQSQVNSTHGSPATFIFGSTIGRGAPRQINKLPTRGRKR